MIVLQIKQCKLCVAIVILSFVCARSVGDIPAESLQELYSDLDGLVMTATMDGGDGRIVYAVHEDGAFSYEQYSKSLYFQYYEGHRDVESEWETHPAHFNYYDGEYILLSSAPFDPAGMYEQVKLKKPIVPGSKVQQLGCLWPLLPGLIQRGVFETDASGKHVLRVEELSLQVIFNNRGFVQQVVWTSGDGKTIGRWKYSGYSNDPNQILPTEMTFWIGPIAEDGLETDRGHVHSLLVFDQDPVRIEDQLLFSDEHKVFYRIDVDTKDVFDPEGEFAYNEDEMAAEYLAALGKGNPKRTRWVLLSVLGVVVVGSVWGLRRRIA